LLISNSFITALDAVNIPFVDDINSPDVPSTFSGATDVTVDRNMHRISAFRAFLPLQLAQARRKNLKISTGTVATKLDFVDVDKTPRAAGVYFEAEKKGGKRYYARARKEIIVCGGAIYSPQILMLR
jgi:choline dehydrogenase-like flavoprotein